MRPFTSDVGESAGLILKLLLIKRTQAAEPETLEDTEQGTLSGGLVMFICVLHVAIWDLRLWAGQERGIAHRPYRPLSPNRIDSATIHASLLKYHQLDPL